MSRLPLGRLRRAPLLENRLPEEFAKPAGANSIWGFQGFLEEIVRVDGVVVFSDFDDVGFAGSRS